MKGSADRLVRLITDLLDLARIEAGQLALYSERLCVREVAAEVLETLRPLAVEKGIDLGLDGALSTCRAACLALTWCAILVL
jgi:two-component system, sensor histidine kinase and response regulator